MLRRGNSRLTPSAAPVRVCVLPLGSWPAPSQGCVDAWYVFVFFTTFLTWSNQLPSCASCPPSPPAPAESFSSWHSTSPNVYLLIMGPVLDRAYASDVQQRVCQSLPGGELNTLCTCPPHFPLAETKRVPVVLLDPLPQDRFHAGVQQAEAMLNSSVRSLQAPTRAAQSSSLTRLCVSAPAHAAERRHVRHHP